MVQDRQRLEIKGGRRESGAGWRMQYAGGVPNRIPHVGCRGVSAVALLRYQVCSDE